MTAHMTKSGTAGGVPNVADVFVGMFQSVLVDLKASPSLWENACAKAFKLSAQLNALANSLATFTDAMQAVSDNANNTKGANRDVGATLTRYCLRQRSLEQLFRAFAVALADRFAGVVEKRLGEWRQRVAEVERRRTRALKKSRQKNGGNAASDDSRDALGELLAEQRAQCLFFVGAFMPAMDAQLNVLDEGSHLHEIRDSLAAASAGHDTVNIIDALLEDAQILSGCASANGRAAVDANGDGIWQRRVSMCSSAAGELMKSASQYLHGQSDDSQSDIISQYGQPLPSSASSITSSGYLHDMYGTVYNAVTDFSSTARTNNTNVCGGQRRAPLNGNTFVPPSCASSIGGEDDLNSLSGSGDSPTMVLGAQRLPPPPPTRRHDTRAIYRYKTQQHRRGVSPADTAASLSISDVSSVNSGPAAVGDIISNVNDDCDGGTMRRPRPLSYNGGDQLPPYGQVTRAETHRSNLLIAETLEQIDRLGVELDSYCETLGPIDAAGHSCSAINDDNGTDSVVKTATIQIQNGVRPLDNASSKFASTTSNDTTALFVSRPETLFTAEVRYRPDSIRVGPPPPPERRNSTITAATPTAPSIADLRSGSSFEQPRRPLAPNNGSTAQAGPVQQRKSSQMFDQYNYAVSRPATAADTQPQYSAPVAQQQQQRQNWQWQQRWNNNQHYSQFASDL